MKLSLVKIKQIFGRRPLISGTSSYLVTIFTLCFLGHALLFLKHLIPSSLLLETKKPCYNYSDSKIKIKMVARNRLCFDSVVYSSWFLVILCRNRTGIEIKLWNSNQSLCFQTSHLRKMCQQIIFLLSYLYVIFLIIIAKYRPNSSLTMS